MELRCKMSVFVYSCIFLVGMCTSQDITSTEPEQGHTLAAETGSNVSIFFPFAAESFLCEDLEVYFLGITKETKREKKILAMYSNWYGFGCGLNITAEYQQRISVQIHETIFMKRHMTIYFLNVSFQDSGKYYITGERVLLGDRILFVSDTSVQTCVGNQMKLHLVISSSVSEGYLIGFYSGWMVSFVVLRDSCLFPLLGPWFVRIRGETILITLDSVQLLDKGIYFLIGDTSGVIYESVFSNVIENGRPGCSTTALTTGKPGTTTELCTEMTGTTEKSFMFQDEYFVGGGVMAGIMLVTLTCLFICKRCRRRSMESRRDAAGGENIDIHYYSTIHSHHQGASESIRTARFDPMSQQRTVVTDMPVMYDEVGRDNITNVPTESTNQTETHYITPY